MIKITEKIVLTEAFNAKSIGMVIGSLSKIINRRLKKSVRINPFSYNVSNQNGRFKSWFIYIAPKNAIRINWLVGSDRGAIHSVDYFENVNDDTVTLKRAKRTALLGEFNIVQVVDNIIEFIRGNLEFTKLSAVGESVENLNESYDAFIDFASVNPPENYPSVSKMHQAYLREVPEGVSYISFAKYVKKWALTNGVDSVPAGSQLIDVVRPSADRYIQPQSHNSISDSFGKILTVEQADEQLLDIEDDINALYNSSTKSTSMFVGGKGGVGKSTSVKNILNSIGASYFFISGSSNITPLALYQTIWKANNFDFIVIDDSDAVYMGNANQNMMKSAMDSKRKRFITLPSSKNESVSRINEIDSNSFLDNTALDPEQDAGSIVVSQETELTTGGIDMNFSPADRAGFEVKPKFIIISNFYEVPQAYTSRFYSTHILNYSNDLVIGLIKSRAVALAKDVWNDIETFLAGVLLKFRDPEAIMAPTSEGMITKITEKIIGYILEYNEIKKIDENALEYRAFQKMLSKYINSRSEESFKKQLEDMLYSQVRAYQN